MAFQQGNLKTKTVVSSSPEDQDKAVDVFQKDHDVRFSQSHVVVDNGKLRYIIVMFYG